MAEENRPDLTLLLGVRIGAGWMSLAVIGSISLRMQHKQGQKQERVCGSRERRLPKVQESKVREDDDGCDAIDGLYHLPVVGCLSLIARFASRWKRSRQSFNGVAAVCGTRVLWWKANL